MSHYLPLVFAAVILGGLAFILIYGTSTRKKVDIPKPGQKKKASDSAEQTARDRFARAVVAAYRSSGRIAAYDSTAFALRHADGGHQGLLQHFGAWTAAKTDEDRKAVLDTVLGVVEEEEEPEPEPLEITADLVREHVVPRVTSRLQLEVARLRARLDGETPYPYIGFGPTMAIDLVLPLGTHFRGVHHLLEDLEIAPQEAYELGIQNFMGSAELKVGKVADGVYRAAIGAPWDPNIALLPGVFGPESNTPVQGRLVVALLTPDVALLTGEDDLEGLKTLVAGCRDASELDTWLSLRPLVHGTQGLEPFAVPPEHPLFGALEQLRVNEEAAAYTIQTELLRKLEARGGGAAVPPVEAVIGEDGTAYTLSTWGPGPTLLPLADRFAVVPAAGERAIVVTREQLREAMGEVPEMEPEIWPPRFRVSGAFPADRVEVLEQLGTALS